MIMANNLAEDMMTRTPMTLDAANNSKVTHILRLTRSKKRMIFVTIYDQTQDISVNSGSWQETWFESRLFKNSVIEPVNQIVPFDIDVGSATLTLDDNNAVITTGTINGQPSIPFVKCTQAFFDRWVKD